MKGCRKITRNEEKAIKINPKLTMRSEGAINDIKTVTIMHFIGSKVK